MCSFDICEADTEFDIPVKSYHLEHFVKKNQIVFEIQVLGLRGLQSVGILPVKKATMQFGFQQLLPAGTEVIAPNVHTDPGPAGANPTMNTLITTKMPLPEDRLLCPSMQVHVNDNILTGFVQPLIGNFVINLGEILFERNDNYMNEIEKLKKLSEDIKAHAEGLAIPDYHEEDKLKKQKEALDQKYQKGDDEYSVSAGSHRSGENDPFLAM